MHRQDRPLAVDIIPIVSIVVPFFGFNQLYNKAPIGYPQKGTTMETTGTPHKQATVYQGSGLGIQFLGLGFRV